MASNRTRLVLKTMALTVAAAALLAALTGTIVLKAGWYHIGATNQHWQLVHTLLEQGMRDSVRRHARHIQAPPLTQSALIGRGAAVYRDNCMLCHGAPGQPQADLAKAMQPVPGPLVDATRRWQPRELYWITRNGIKMSGMPAWEFHLADADLWAVVAFLQKLPELSAPAFAAMIQAEAPPFKPAPALEPAPARRAADPQRGRLALTQYACHACHMIPGVTGSQVHVGRPLEGLARRKFIAGSLPNTPHNLVRWIRNPKEIDPDTAMPVQGVTEQDALDIASYLLTLP